jgi:hypothetical protein
MASTPQEKYIQLNEKINKILKSLKNVKVETSGTSTLVHVIKWDTAVNRSKKDIGWHHVIDLLEKENINYSLNKISSDTLNVVEIDMPSLPSAKGRGKKPPSKIRLRFKYQSVGKSFNDAYKTKMGEALVAWSLIYRLRGGSKELEVDSITDGTELFGKFNLKISGKNSLWGNKEFRSDCSTFMSIYPEWQKSINKAAEVLKKTYNFSTTGNWVIELPSNLDSTENPYDVYNKISPKLKIKLKDDKWNPGDIWFINSIGKTALSNYKRDFNDLNTHTEALSALNEFNGVLIENFNSGNILAMSLKKLGDVAGGYNVRTKIVNEKNYFDEEVKFHKFILGKNNQDIQIYMKVRKVERDPNTEKITKRYPFYNDEIYLKMKTKSGGYRLELNITGTEARHGSLGQEAYQTAIRKTDRLGIDKLGKVRKNKIYDNLNFGNASGKKWVSYEVTKNANENEYMKINLYLSEIFNYVNGTNNVSFNESDMDWVQSKIVASEIGYSIKGTGNKLRMDMICENLYRIASSRGMIYGTSSQVERVLRNSKLGKDKQLTGLGAREIIMNASIHAKVY